MVPKKFAPKPQNPKTPKPHEKIIYIFAKEIYY